MALHNNTNRGKKYKQSLEKYNRDSLYSLQDAVQLAIDTSTTSFDSSVEIHLNLGADPKQADQMIRGTISLPHGTGKKLRVIAFVGEDKVSECKEAGAIEAGSAELIEKISKENWMDFDIAVAEPTQMKNMGKIAKTLGQKGLMPNPKAGTVSPDPASVIKEINAGRVEYKLDKQGNVHNLVGKCSFGAEKLLENVNKYLDTIKSVKPSGIKGTYIKSITLASTMGPGIKIDVSNI